MKTVSILLFLTVTLGIKLLSQSLIVSNDFSFGSNSDDYRPYILVLENTNLILAGSSSSGIGGEKTELNIGGSDFWVLCMDTSGNVLWDKTLGGSLDEELTDLVLDYDGNILLSGFSQSDASGTKTENSRGGYDQWIVKLDTLGNILWDKTIGGNAQENNCHILPFIHEGYLLANSSTSNENTGDKTSPNYGQKDFWIIALDSNLNTMWDMTYGSIDEDKPSGILKLDHSYLIYGSSASDSSETKSENSRGGLDYWLLQIDSLGTVLNDMTIGSGSTDYLVEVEQRGESLIASGYSNGNATMDKTVNSYGWNDYWILNISENLDSINWQTGLGGNDDDILESITLLDEGILCHGYSLSDSSGIKSESSMSDWDQWFTRLYNDGTFVWDKTIGGNNEESYGMTISSQNQLWTVCQSNSSISRDKTTLSRGAFDYWLIKLHANDLLTHENIAFNKGSEFLSLFPNPSKNILHFNGVTLTHSNFEIYDAMGNIVHRGIMQENTVNIENVGKGLFFIKIITAQNADVYTKSFIKN